MTIVRHVLVVDDEPDIRDVVELSLYLTAGWYTSTAATGEAGLVMARATLPDCVLLDVMMPGLDGFATLRALRDDPVTRSIPVLFLTAKGTADLRRRSWEAGALGIVTKPFDPMALPQEIAALLGWDDARPRSATPPSAA